jgi:hypothetical protein
MFPDLFPDFVPCVCTLHLRLRLRCTRLGFGSRCIAVHSLDALVFQRTGPRLMGHHVCLCRCLFLNFGLVLFCLICLLSFLFLSASQSASLPSVSLFQQPHTFSIPCLKTNPRLLPEYRKSQNTGNPRNARERPKNTRIPLPSPSQAAQVSRKTLPKQWRDCRLLSSVLQCLRGNTSHL